jgi:hypothetical protein
MYKSVFDATRDACRLGFDCPADSWVASLAPVYVMHTEPADSSGCRKVGLVISLTRWIR